MRSFGTSPGKQAIAHAGIVIRQAHWNDRDVMLGGVGGVMTHPDFRCRGYAREAVNRAVDFFGSGAISTWACSSASQRAHTVLRTVRMAGVSGEMFAEQQGEKRQVHFRHPDDLSSPFDERTRRRDRPARSPLVNAPLEKRLHRHNFYAIFTVSPSHEAIALGESPFPCRSGRRSTCAGASASAFGRAITAAKPSSATIRPPWPGIGSTWGRSACTWSISTGPATAGRRICRAFGRFVDAVDVPCELGGGIRDEESIRELLDLGLRAAGDRHAGPARARLVSPDVPAVSRPAGAGDRRPRRPGGHRRLAGDQRRGGDRVGPAGSPASRWRRSIYTDIATDGMMAGPNVAAMAEMQAAVELPVIASGGVTTPDDVARLAAVPMAGCIIGRALV